jgi:hypothetical protein
MDRLVKYRRKERTEVTAVQVDLETDGFTYRKWGGTQRCKRGDWLVNNSGDFYTIDQDVFAKTYRESTPGRFVKDSPVWAVQADEAGTIKTKEGSTDYAVGDFLVYNDSQGRDGYAMSAMKFRSLYELESS